MFYYGSKIGWFLATPSNLFPVLIVLGLVLMRLRWARLGSFVSAAGCLLLLVAGLSPLANAVILPLEARFAAFRDDGGRVDGVIVLGGAVQAEASLARGQLITNEAGERVIAMADLARRYPAARIVFSGGGSTLITEEVAESHGLLRFIGALGLAPDRVLFEDRSRTTYENAVFTRALVAPKPGERWLLVTSAWHMPRAVGCFRQAGFPVTAYPVDFRTRGPGDLLRPFAFASEGLRRLDVASREWAGLFAYRLVGYTDSWFPASDGSDRPHPGSASR